ncbi:hypothetical protein NQ315_014240 [Exocentrus adspersus]|uniref:DDE Tnp4 domain-containing protein n=1 Tax=Exocentrus adspersus TaxID=1586481 RepID=A0AAV8VC08_9CUCU|nr:hypothetical protein NQ315_014240 [Exocentrus adspersus]
MKKNVCTQANIRTLSRNIKTNTEPVQTKCCETSQSHSEYLPSSPSTSEEIVKIEQSNFEELRRRSTVALIEKKSRFYLGLPKHTYCLVKLLTEWVHIDHTHGDTHSRLADDFGCSTSNISQIFMKSVIKISGVLQNFVFWPEVLIVKRFLPIPFRYRYNKVYSIIDCLEIEIEKPSNPLMQSLTWSEYKKCNTLKFLISCTPNGFINFISGAFGGRISDKDISQKSEYLQHLPNNIWVMADRGFKQIENLLAEKNCKLVRPPSVADSKKSSRQEVHEAKRIAALMPVCTIMILKNNSVKSFLTPSSA